MTPRHRTTDVHHARRRRACRAAIAVTCGLLVAACGADGGGSSGGGGGRDGVREVREDDLELGGLVAEPSEVPETAGTLANGRAVEATRIAELVVDPNTVDARFQGAALPSGALASPSQLTRLLSSEDPKLVGQRVSGATSRRYFADDSLDMSIAVLTFPSAAVARTVVRRIGDDNARSGINPITKTQTYGEPTTIAGHPEARASLFRVDRVDPDPSLTVLAAYDTAVVYLFLSGDGKRLPLAKQVAAEALTAQREALEGFEPTALDGLLELPVDETGVAELTLDRPRAAVPEGEPDVVVVWGPNGALHQQSWAGELAAAFERAELDAMAQAGSNVYRTGSAEQARQLLDDFEQAATAKQYERDHEPKGLRDARCYDLVDETEILLPFCQVQFGRYVAEAGGATRQEAEDAISAQYLVLQEHAPDA